ncbi:MAG: response regulator [Thiotrichaceae bacterium]|nr:response regulator [Thiotrichaceae bacterium]
MNLQNLRLLFEEELNQVKVFEAQSGVIALNCLMKEKVDLIILDVQMAQMDGFETAKFIRSRKKSQNIPIIFLTAAYKSDDFKRKGYELGACDYITKPIDSDPFIKKIKDYLHRIQQGETLVAV